MAMERWSHSTERITREDVDTFADLSGDKNVLHMDEAVAEKSRFNGTIVHGVLVEGLVSRAISDLAHPGEVAVFIEKETKFIAPVRPGDLVEVEAGVRVENIDPDSAVRQPAFSVKAGPDAENMSLVMKGSATVMFDSVGL